MPIKKRFPRQDLTPINLLIAAEEYRRLVKQENREVSEAVSNLEPPASEPSSNRTRFYEDEEEQSKNKMRARTPTNIINEMLDEPEDLHFLHS